MKIGEVFGFVRRNLNRIEAILIIFAIIGATMTLVIGGSVRSDTIRIVDASKSMASPYGELNSNSILGYDDNFSRWTTSSNIQINTTKTFLLVSGYFQNSSTWTSVTLFKNVNVNLTDYPILAVNLNLTTGVRYGIRFFAQYPNGTQYDVWWEGSPLDHRSGIGSESFRVNMQREAFLATGFAVETINKVELYIEDRPYSPQSFQFTLYRLSFENYALAQISNDQYRAVYYDLNNTPQENVSWSLNKINFGLTVQATQGATFSIYFFNGPLLYASTTATGQVYNSLTPYPQITFYPNVQPQIFPELLPLSNTSIVFVATSGTLQSVTVQYANFEFLPTTTSPSLAQQSVGLYYVYFIFFLFLLPVGIAILAFREFFPRASVPKNNMIVVLVIGILCRLALATTTAHVFDMNVYLTSIRSWYQYRSAVGSVGPTLPFTFFLYWMFYSPYALLQLAGFPDIQILGHAAGIVESVFVKLFPIAMDVMTFFLFLRFRKDGATFVWATFYFLNPLSIFVSSVWGQYEAATAAFIVWGVYWMWRNKAPVAGLAFVASGMIELFGFLPYLLLLLKTARMKLYKTAFVTTLAVVPCLVYLPEALQILRLLLGFTGASVANSALSQPGRYSLIGNFPQFSIISQYKPLLVSQILLLGFAFFDVCRGKMEAKRVIFYVALSSVSLLLFSNLIAFWFWLLPVGLLYAVVTEKNDLGAFMLVFGTGITFLEATYAFSSNYLIFGNFGPLVGGIEGIRNALKITSIMATFLAITFLMLLRYGSGRAQDTIIRTAAMSLSLYLLLYFWLGLYSL